MRLGHAHAGATVLGLSEGVNAVVWRRMSVENISGTTLCLHGAFSWSERRQLTGTVKGPASPCRVRDTGEILNWKIMVIDESLVCSLMPCAFASRS